MSFKLDGTKFKAWADNGTPLVGGLLYTYVSGTTTNKATYTSSTLGVANTNPIVLDARGEADVWLGAGAYTFTLKTSAGVTVDTVDDVMAPADLGNATDPAQGAGAVGFDYTLAYGAGTIGKWLKDNVTLLSDLAASGSASLVGWIQSGTGSVLRTVQDKLRDTISVKDFGAVGDGIADDTAAINVAISACAVLMRNLYFPPGTYKITSTIALGSNPIALIGEPYAVRQQGSQRPSVTLRWTGGAAPMFTMTNTSTRFIGLAAENFGTATDFVQSDVTQFLHVEDCSFLVGAGASQFSRSIFGTDSNAFGYSKLVRVAFHGAAPSFMYINGNGSTNGITQIEFSGGLYESNSTGNVTVFRLIDCSVTSLIMRGITFNQQLNELCIVDTTGTPRSTTLSAFTFQTNEVDTASCIATDRRFKLTNAINVSIEDNFFACGGAVTAMASLVNTTVCSFKGNYAKSISGPFFSADTLSRVYSGTNDFVIGNTQGVINDAATGSGVIPLTYGPTVMLLGHLAMGTGVTVFRINVTNATAWTLSLAHPGIGAGGYFVRGQVFGVQVRNVSGGAMGAITLAGTYFKLSGAAFPAPANGNSRTVFLMWDGANLVEVSRTPTDVPN